MYEKYPVYAKGSIVNIVDRVEPTIKTLCTIKAIEQDDIDRTLYFKNRIRCSSNVILIL